MAQGGVRAGPGRGRGSETGSAPQEGRGGPRLYDGTMTTRPSEAELGTALPLLRSALPFPRREGKVRDIYDFPTRDS
jgi:hypothetical protein